MTLPVLVTGLTGSGHASSANFVGSHCNNTISASVESPHLVHVLNEQIDPVSDGNADKGFAGCSPYLCHALAVVHQHPRTSFGDVQRIVEWRTEHLPAQTGPDNPDRPPNP
ncbi:hypothetical protein [Hoeflea prorocentri]|uniref:Uncharacterized protein n=1 Tax=Hoeflea prorocentri TaxID=1922333 RepID=A0A9X3UMG1_9HYPH|nr:hypothetical protein [Hoeflea prorocentri]MCY6383362.1 hypothetical protein [Hoeflea prorocentri]MDA5401162.1 hypothetical protein [Hoeflea prorocentri]